MLMIGKMKAMWRHLVGDESYLGGPGRRGVEDKLQPGQACLSNGSEDYFISIFILQQEACLNWF